MIHTCKLLQGFTRVKRFARGKVDLRIGNGVKVVALAMDTYPLRLYSGLVLELNNCYCVLHLIRILFPLHVWSMMVIMTL
jgi:hypothetical protein